MQVKIAQAKVAYLDFKIKLRMSYIEQQIRKCEPYIEKPATNQYLNYIVHVFHAVCY